MQRFVAFLGSINVGGRVVKMDRLRALFQELEFNDVSTFIASGNVIFDATPEDETSLEDRVEEHLASRLGYKVPVFLRSAPEVAAILQNQPFDDSSLEKGDTILTVLLKAEPPITACRSLAAMSTDTDQFDTWGRQLYWLCRTSIARSRAGIQMAKVLAMPGTSRNINTLRRLAKIYMTDG